MWFSPLVESPTLPRFWRVFVLLAVWAGVTSMAEASRPLRGMVWTPPADSSQALSEIQALADFGVEAVRTSVWPHTGVLDVLAREGIALYFDLPIRFGTPSTYRGAWPNQEQTLENVRRTVEGRALTLAIGLGIFPFSRSEEVCAELAKGQARVAELLPQATVYFETAFPEERACHEVVDLVLLDLRESSTLRQSSFTFVEGDTPLGIGALGTHVLAGRFGLNSPNSPESQARFLESALTGLMNDPNLPVFFVLRWRDIPSVLPDFRDAYENPYLPSYGLIDQAGQPRPAYHVARQFFSASFDVFAYPGGAPPRTPIPWEALISLGLWLMLGSHYSNSVRFRNLLPRLFNAPGFYRSNVREARDTLAQTATILTLVVAVGSGVFWALVYENMRGVLALTFVVERLPDLLLHAFAFLQSHPLLLIGSFALVQVALTLTGALGISVFAGNRNGLYPSQGLALIGLPRLWILLVLLALLSIQGEAYTPKATMQIVLVWLGFSVLSTLRTFLDVVAMTRISGGRLWFLVGLHPTFLIALAFLISYVLYRESWDFFRLLLTAF